MNGKIRYSCKTMNKIADWIFYYRYVIGGAFFLIGVLLEINGSSVGCWENIVPGGECGRIILGNSRPIRSDEWTVSTSMLLSQYKAGFPYFNNLYRAAGTDMFIVYGQPVKDIAIIFRPFHWGYLFLPFAKGLAFYWCGKSIALALTSFELGMLITNRNKQVSFLYMIMICLAPVTQWWFAVNAFPDMLVYGQLAVLLIYYYLNTSSYYLRFIIGIIFALCCGAYALVFYPAWQIPFAYAFLMLAIWAIWENRKRAISKKDGIILSVSLMILIGGLGYVVVKSFDTIQMVLNTAYPGARCETGGTGLFRFAFYPGNILFSMKEPWENGIVAPEWSVMFDLFPMGQLLAMWVLLKEKNRDFLIILFESAWALLMIYVVFGMNESVAKITLLSNSTIARVYIAVGYLNILLLIRSIALVKQSVPIKKAMLASIVLALGIVYLSKRQVYGLYLSDIITIITILLLTVLFMCLFEYKNMYMQKVLITLLSVCLFISSGYVNPVRQGSYDIGRTGLGKAIQQLDKMDSGIWLAATGDGTMGDFLGAAGVPVINSTNTYPVLERWQKLDPEKQNEHIYNRYAHIEVEISEEETLFSLPYPDVFKVRLNYDDISKLSAKYILTKNTTVLKNTDEIRFEHMYMDQNFSIYRVADK